MSVTNLILLLFGVYISQTTAYYVGKIHSPSCLTNGMRCNANQYRNLFGSTKAPLLRMTQQTDHSESSNPEKDRSIEVENNHSKLANSTISSLPSSSSSSTQLNWLQKTTLKLRRFNQQLEERRKQKKSSFLRSPKGSINSFFNKCKILLKNILTNPERRFSFLLTLILLLRILQKFFMKLFKNSSFIEISYSNFFNLLTISPDRIIDLKVTPNAFYYLLDGQKLALTRLVKLPPSILGQLMNSGINFYTPAPPMNWLALLPSLLLLMSMFFTSRMLQGPRDTRIGKTKEHLQLEENYGNLSFDDIAGQETAKLEVSEICDMLKNPLKYTKVGARLPSGVLLVGPPGSGKTLLARITASVAKVPFYSCSASEFVEIYVGRGPARIRQLFQAATKTAPCIIFIDEIDSIGRSRKMNSWNSEQETTLNQLLTCMDGLETSNNGVIVMAATNRMEFLDSALLRAGRFDRVINCPLPDK